MVLTVCRVPRDPSPRTRVCPPAVSAHRDSSLPTRAARHVMVCCSFALFSPPLHPRHHTICPSSCTFFFVLVEFGFLIFLRVLSKTHVSVCPNQQYKCFMDLLKGFDDYVFFARGYSLPCGQIHAQRRPAVVSSLLVRHVYGPSECQCLCTLPCWILLRY